ncbi:hypothetical protein C7C45_04845 [Micromonospora arborensis]|uniref:Helix-turn-helix domain-containing protein n=1 Tax=Micromonospora arborensis TaxID=2116518 RepID=A0A318NV88_9ACTN|nr:hypothetical protein [Micromonospora arborensis]PYC75199.1 hypothetical protein C7C45_04845 [Micromonospora arborensis]
MSTSGRAVLFDWLDAFGQVNRTGKYFSAAEMGIIFSAATYANTNTGAGIFPGYKLLQTNTRANRNTISKALDKARAARVFVRVGEGDWQRGTSDEYRLGSPSLWNLSALADPGDPSSTEIDTREQVPEDPPSTEIDTQSSTEIDTQPGTEIGTTTTHVTTHVTTQGSPGIFVRPSQVEAPEPSVWDLVEPLPPATPAMPVKVETKPTVDVWALAEKR